MTTMSQATLMAVGLAAVIGIGSYEIGQHNGMATEAQRFGAENSAIPPSSAPAPGPNAPVPGNPGAAYIAPPREEAAIPPFKGPARTGVLSTDGTTFVQEHPVVDKTNVTRSTSTYSDTDAAPGRNTRTETVVTEKPRTREVTKKVYYRKLAYHHSSGKIHMHKAVKHTAMFVAKLPGRLRL